jgi:hypothetical protein
MYSVNIGAFAEASKGTRLAVPCTVLLLGSWRGFSGRISPHKRSCIRRHTGARVTLLESFAASFPIQVLNPNCTKDPDSFFVAVHDCSLHS